MPFEEAVADQPEQQTEATETQETATEGQELASAEADGSQSQEQGQAQADGTEQDADWLPDEQLKVFPDEQYERYAQKRYPELVNALKDENLAEPTRKQLKQLLHDKINSDIEIGKFKTRPEQEEESVEEETPEQENQPQAQWTPQQREQAISHFVDQVTDPEVAEKFIGDFTKAFDIKDPRQRAVAATKVLSRGMMNLLPDALNAVLFAPEGQKGVLDSYIERRYEGLGETVQQTTYSRTWNDIVASDPKLAGLPAYDTRPNSEWTKAIEKVAAMVPGFENFTIPGASKAQNFAAKSRIAINLMRGGVNNANAIATAQEAVETGKRIANESNRNKQLGKLGAGQSKGQLAQKTSDDPLKATLAAHKADNNPFAALGPVKGTNRNE